MTKEVFSQQEALEAGKLMIIGTKHLRNLGGFSLLDTVIDKAALARTFTLSKEQRELVMEVCQNNRFT